MKNPIAKRFSRNAFPAAILLAGLLFVILLLLTGKYIGKEAEVFTRDPSSLYKFHPLAGILSNLGILFWASTMAICLFAYAALTDKKSRRARLILYSGLFTGWLMLDDFFLFHDRIFPDFLGINEKITFGVYGLIFLAGGITFIRTILSTDYTFLVLGMGLFGLSIFVDLLYDDIAALTNHDLAIMLEDGSKFLGILGWSVFFWQLCLSRIQDTQAPAFPVTGRTKEDIIPALEKS